MSEKNITPETATKNATDEATDETTGITIATKNPEGNKEHTPELQKFIDDTSCIIQNVKNEKSVVAFLEAKNPNVGKKTLKAFVALLMPEKLSNGDKTALDNKKADKKLAIEIAKATLSSLIQEKQAIQSQLNGLSAGGDIRVTKDMAKVGKVYSINIL